MVSDSGWRARTRAVLFDRLIRPDVLPAGTTRCDGSPRINGVEPLVMDRDCQTIRSPGRQRAGPFLYHSAMARIPVVLTSVSLSSPAT